MTTADPIITNLLTAAMTYGSIARAYDTARDIRSKTTGVDDYDRQEAACDKILDALYDAEDRLKAAARLCTVDAARAAGLVSK